MRKKRGNHLFQKTLSLLLAFALVFGSADFGPKGAAEIYAAEAISIANAADLAKIGRDARYPMAYRRY